MRNVELRFGMEARMESMTVTSADGNGTLAVTSAVPGHFYVHSEAAAKRSAGLRRLLATADFAAGALSGLIAGLVAQAPVHEVALLGLMLAIAWPFGAFACGLYAADDLRTWASGVSEAPKLVLASLLLSWPLFGVLRILDAPHAVRAALVGCVLVAATAGLARASARIYAHHAKGLRQRTLVIGSGLVADQLVERLLRHDELALDPIGFLDADGDGHGDMACPRSAASRPCPTCCAPARRPRDDRLLARRPRGAAALHPPLPRRRGGGRRRPAPVRVPRRRAHGRPDRRHAAALDHGADLHARLGGRQAHARPRPLGDHADRARAAAAAGGGRDQARLARPGAVRAAALGARQPVLPALQVPVDAGRHDRRGARRRRHRQVGRRRPHHARRAGSSGASRSTRRPSSSTCCAAT